MAKNKTPLDLLLLCRLLFLTELSSRNKLVYLFEGTKHSLWLSLSADESQGKQKFFKISEQHCGCNINFWAISTILFVYLSYVLIHASSWRRVDRVDYSILPGYPHSLDLSFSSFYRSTISTISLAHPCFFEFSP